MERNIQTQTKPNNNKYLHNNQSFIVYTKHSRSEKNNNNNKIYMKMTSLKQM
jgi:hypothetical protein